MGKTPAVELSPAQNIDDLYVQAAFLEAVQEWFAGNAAPLHEKFPGAFCLLELIPVKTFRAAIEKSITIRREAAEAIANNLIQFQKEAIFSVDMAEAEIRPFDIIARYNHLLIVEQSMIEQGIIDVNKKFIVSRKNSNKQCLAGIYRLLIRNGYFKKFDSGKSGKDKKVTIQDIYKFMNIRYSIHQFQELRRQANYEDLALMRLPVIEILEKGGR